MSTVHDDKGIILRNKKNAAPLVKKSCGNKHEMKLYIPDFEINGYNHSKNGVDIWTIYWKLSHRKKITYKSS
jgi:hypothetical protein